MASLRFGSFKPNYSGLALMVSFFLCFLLYILGYGSFIKYYRYLYLADDQKSIHTLQWFFVGCPVTMLLVSILLFIVSSFTSRQVILGFSALLVLGAAGFMLIAAWIGTNISRFNQEKGWEVCPTQHPEQSCNRLKIGIHAFLIGAVLCCLNCILDIGFCFARARQLKMNEALYVGLQSEESGYNQPMGPDIELEETHQELDLDDEDEDDDMPIARQ